MQYKIMHQRMTCAMYVQQRINTTGTNAFPVVLMYKPALRKYCNI